MLTPPNNTIIRMKYIEEAIKQEKYLSTERCMKRLNEMERIVQKNCNGKVKHIFRITDNERDVISKSIQFEIGKFKVQKIAESVKDYHFIIRRKWNRKKPKKLGDLMIDPIIRKIARYMHSECNSSISTLQRLLIFVNIWIDICESKVKYSKQSMARPIIPMAIYSDQNGYKILCQQFLTYFGHKLMKEHEKLSWIGLYSDPNSVKHSAVELSTEWIKALYLLQKTIISIKNGMINDDDINSLTLMYWLYNRHKYNYRLHGDSVYHGVDSCIQYKDDGHNNNVMERKGNENMDRNSDCSIYDDVISILNELVEFQRNQELMIGDLNQRTQSTQCDMDDLNHRIMRLEGNHGNVYMDKHSCQIGDRNLSNDNTKWRNV